MPMKNPDQSLCVNRVFWLLMTNLLVKLTLLLITYCLVSFGYKGENQRGVHSTSYSYILLHSSNPKYRMNSTKRLAWICAYIPIIHLCMHIFRESSLYISLVLIHIPLSTYIWDLYFETYPWVYITYVVNIFIWVYETCVVHICSYILWVYATCVVRIYSYQSTFNYLQIEVIIINYQRGKDYGILSHHYELMVCHGN